jgi:hypothetical protein
LDGELLPVLMAMYETRASLEIDRVADAIWAMLLDTYDLDDVEPKKLELHRGLVNRALRRTLDRLEELGVVTQSGIERRPTEWGTTDEVEGVVVLTPLGGWVVGELLTVL